MKQLYEDSRRRPRKTGEESEASMDYAAVMNTRQFHFPPPVAASAQQTRFRFFYIMIMVAMIASAATFLLLNHSIRMRDFSKERMVSAAKKELDAKGKGDVIITELAEVMQPVPIISVTVGMKKQNERDTIIKEAKMFQSSDSKNLIVNVVKDQGEIAPEMTRKVLPLTQIISRNLAKEETVNVVTNQDAITAEMAEATPIIQSNPVSTTTEPVLKKEAEAVLKEISDKPIVTLDEIETPAKDTYKCLVEIPQPPPTEEAKVSLRILILTFDRAQSLNRLLYSLNCADYMGDTVELHIFIDRAVKNGSISGINSTNYMHFEINDYDNDEEGIDRDVVEVSKRFAPLWGHGLFKIHQRKTNYGLGRQWLDSWQDSLPEGEILGENTEGQALILEDDLEVSPYFWQWLKAAHAATKHRSDVAGLTLQRLNFCTSYICRVKQHNGGPENSTINFLAPQMGSWGYSPIATMWSQFVPWVKAQIEAGVVPYLTHAKLVTKIYQNHEKTGRCPGLRCMWTIWHLLWVEKRINERVYTVYVRCPFNTTLNTNHKEAGLHFTLKGSSDFPLFTGPVSAILDFPANLSILDWHGNVEFGPGYDPIAFLPVVKTAKPKAKPPTKKNSTTIKKPPAIKANSTTTIKTNFTTTTTIKSNASSTPA